ncbi:MAG: hypothetical protein EI684_16455 [Candidatus Viridilinea halotolerans]|uniref:Uncharacterized protein n=1 Tax=Candidatus Viridilinea halotolerans TaxID=2491704 RepID=A0A426TVD9_9CHLR|nr:MAG: hypothetical protein EI684_16455 [Candidatus Viridilinea halotolerans]
MTTYARPRLIAEDDPRYRAHVAQFVLLRKNQKAMRPPRQRELFGGQAEAALRTWLDARLELDDRRILEYEERRNRRGFIKYRELDGLHIAARTAHVFEIKASRSASALRRAIGQLQETRAILRLLYPVVAVTILLVDTGIPADQEALEALMSSERPPPRRPELFAEVLEALPDLHFCTSFEQTGDAERVGLLRFSVEDIIAIAGAENLALAWEEDDLEPDEPPEPRPTSSLYTTSEPNETPPDDDDDNPMAAAMRRAGLK